MNALQMQHPGLEGLFPEHPLVIQVVALAKD
jgi:hypothetical protein